MKLEWLTELEDIVLVEAQGAGADPWHLRWTLWTRHPDDRWRLLVEDEPEPSDLRDVLNALAGQLPPFLAPIGLVVCGTGTLLHTDSGTAVAHRTRSTLMVHPDHPALAQVRSDLGLEMAGMGLELVGGALLDALNALWRKENP